MTDLGDITHLRETHYNATLVELRFVHDELAIFRIQPDEGVPQFQPGQFVSLGLGYWEPRVAGAQAEQLDELHRARLAKRAYSMSGSILNARHELVRAEDADYLEFYITLVRVAARHPPALTPRLFALREGDRLFVEHRVNGHYTLESVGLDDDLVFLATGTGEAPHNAMIAHLLHRRHRGHMIAATCVRYRRDLGYLAVHRELQQRFANYGYFALTTREPENTDRSLPGYVGKRYLQDFVRSGEFEKDCGVDLDPSRVHVFLCGSPDMIGIPQKLPGAVASQPAPAGMIKLLNDRGFQTSHPHAAGNIHFERYW